MAKIEYPWLQSTFESLLKRIEGLPNALLLHGQVGTGKRALAEALAMAILCETPSERPCGRCQSCRLLQAGSHPDLRVVEPEANQAVAADPEADGEPAKATKAPSLEIKVEQIRALADFLAIGSHRGGRRVAIVHPAEDMNLNAANALLKSLEEPPAAAVFVLVSDRPGRLLPTIRSRCVPQPVPAPDAASAEKWLLAQEVPDARQWLAYAGGSPLRAAQLARGEAGALISALRRMPDPSGLRDVRFGGRPELEVLVDYLQKQAIDETLVGLGCPPRYGVGVAKGASPYGRLKLARDLGRERRALRQPLNPALFVEVCIAAVEASRSSKVS